MLERAKIVSVSGNYADITKDGASILRRIPVVGDASVLTVNQQVFVSYVDNRMVVLTGGTQAASAVAASSGDGMVPHPMSYHTDAISWHAGLSGAQLHNPKAHASSHLSGGSDPVDHDSLTNFVSNEHINHTSVTLTAGDGLTGGGDISANRTFAVGAGTLITVEADTVGITAGANYQFIGTGSGTAAGWRNVSELAGAGLGAASGVLAVGAGDGIDIADDSIAVDVTDFIDTDAGLKEDASNNIQINIGTGMAFSSGALYAYALRQSDYGDNALVADAAGDLTAYGSLAFNVAESITTNDGDLTINPAVKLVVLTDIMLDGDNRIYEEYVSGYFGAGYAIGYDGVKSYLEVDDLTVRHTLRTHIFQYDIVRATNGYLYIADASEITQPASGSYIYVKEPVFAPGDLLWYKDYDLDDTLTISSVQMTVTAGPTEITNNGVTHQRYTVTADSGSLANLSAGGTVVRVGNTTDTDRQGALYMDASSTFSPFMDVIDGVDSWTAFGAAAKTKARLGNLEGITGDAEYGLWAGEGTGVGDSYLLISNVNVALHDIPMFFYDSGNNQRIGLVPDAGATDKLMWAGVSESDPGFVVYGDGTVWLSTLAISEQLGDLLFSKADGLALWGPGCAITPTLWTSTRGQTAAISGAFHQVAGPWANSKALVVEGGSTNIHINPIGLGTGGYSTFDVTKTTVDDDAVVGKVSRFTSSGTYSDRHQIWSTADLTGDVIGQTYAVRFKARASIPTNAVCRVRRKASPYTVKSNTEYFDLETYWQQYFFVLTLTADIVDSWDMVELANKTFGSYDYIDLAEVQIEKLSYSTSLIWGGAGTGYVWNGDGTPHANTSTRTATVVNLSAHAGLISGNNTVTFSLWIQAQYDADDANWPSGANDSLVFDYRGADNNNRVAVAFDPTNSDALQFYINGSNRVNAENQTFTAGDWLHIVAVQDFTNDVYRLYLNGVLLGSSTASLTAPTAIVDWCLGTVYNAAAGYSGGFAFGEYAVFGRALTAEEVAALYARGKPLVDAGALKRPGIYIMDGEIDLRTSQTGARVQIDANGVGGYSAATTKTFSLETDGDLFLGSNISAAATTAFAVFATAQTYNYESVGAGDVLLGDNSAGKINLLWDMSEGDVLLRRGTSTRIKLDGSTDIITVGDDSSKHLTVSPTDVRLWDGANALVQLTGSYLVLGTPGASNTTMDLSAADGVRIWRGGTTLLGHWKADGSIAIGASVPGANNVQITSAGAISIRNYNTDRISMTAAGVLTINDSGGNAVITLDASAGAEITRKLTMPGANSAITIGATPPTSSSAGTGIWIDRTGFYALATNAYQVKIDATNGKFYAGGGEVIVDTSGISIATGTSDQNYIKWTYSGTAYGKISTYIVHHESVLYMLARAIKAADEYSTVLLNAQATYYSKSYNLRITTGGVSEGLSFDAGAASVFSVSTGGDVSMDGDLTVLGNEIYIGTTGYYLKRYLNQLSWCVGASCTLIATV